MGLVFNDITYIPNFEQSFIDTLPAILQAKLNKDFSRVLDLRTIYKFKNLQSL